jgi:hypothetical protein
MQFGLIWCYLVPISDEHNQTIRIVQFKSDFRFICWFLRPITIVSYAYMGVWELGTATNLQKKVWWECSKVWSYIFWTINIMLTPQNFLPTTWWLCENQNGTTWWHSIDSSTSTNNIVFSVQNIKTCIRCFKLKNSLQNYFFVKNPHIPYFF